MGCTHEEIYTSIQSNEEVECQKNPEVAREECMKTVSEPYEDYRRALDELPEQER